MTQLQRSAMGRDTFRSSREVEALFSRWLLRTCLEGPFSLRIPQLLAAAEDGFWETLGRGHGGLRGLHHHPPPPTHPPPAPVLFLPPVPPALPCANCSLVRTFAMIPGAAEVGTKVQL